MDRVKPSLDEQELVDILIEAQVLDYFQHLATTIGRPFFTEPKIREIVEDVLKSRRIVR